MATQDEIINKVMRGLGGRPPDHLDRVGLHRIALAWICYGVGGLFLRAAEPWYGHREWTLAIFSKFMQWSDDLQSNDPRGPWSAIVD